MLLFLLAAVDDECALDSDCKFEGTTCQNARCKAGTVEIEYETIKNDNTRSAYDLNVDCESDSDCSDVSNAVCSPLSKKCICKRGYFYDSTGCIAGNQSYPYVEICGKW